MSNDTAYIRLWEKQHLKFMQGRQPQEERGKKNFFMAKQVKRITSF